MKKYILALDQGTTSCRAALVDADARIVNQVQQEFSQYFPQPGQVEHNPIEIWSTQVAVTSALMAKTGVNWQQIHAIGITNQRETTLAWNKITGEPAGNALVWQDRRTLSICQTWQANGWDDLFYRKTGLVVDAYFSASKMRWILDNQPKAAEWNAQNELCLGTIDSWLVWKLSGGKSFVTDCSNASRTLLVNLETGNWDDELLALTGIPRNALAKIHTNHAHIADTQTPWIPDSIPIHGMAGDQQAALFGQLCLDTGDTKCTYGTGCFLMMQTGPIRLHSNHRLLSTIAWDIGQGIQYALEGSVFMGGALIQWLRDGLGIIQQTGQAEALAQSVPDNGGVVVVPAFTGLGAPYWKPEVTGMITGLTRGITSAHIARASLEAIAFQVNDVLACMEQDSGRKIQCVKADGGAVKNTLLMQFQANLSQVKIDIPAQTESTVLGAAFFAGIGSGFWKGTEELIEKRKTMAVYENRAADFPVRESRQWAQAIRRMTE